MLLVHVLNVAFVHSRLVLIGRRIVYNVAGSCTEFFHFRLVLIACRLDWLWLVYNVVGSCTECSIFHSRLVLIGCRLDWLLAYL